MRHSAREKLFDGLGSLHLIPIPIESIIRKQGIKFGSYVFGGFTETSDIDILVLLDGKDNTLAIFNDFYFRNIIDSQYMRYIPGQYRHDGCEFLSIYIRCRFTPRPVNIMLFYDSKIYFKWADATIITKKAIEDVRMRTLLQNKQNRVLYFETIKEILAR